MSVGLRKSYSSTMKRKYLLEIITRTAKRTIYNGSDVIYPSSKWFDNYSRRNVSHQELINPAMSANVLSLDEVAAVKAMLNGQGKILQEAGSAYLLNPIRQTVEQYLYGVSDLIDVEAAAKELIGRDVIDDQGCLNKNYDENDLDRVRSENSHLKSALNGIMSYAMDTIYFANMWLYMGRSQKLFNRPIVVLQTPKYPIRQIERYYGIIACMALGITPVQVGKNAQQRYHFEGMADVLPLTDKYGNSVLLTVNSSRTQSGAYNEIKHIHNDLLIMQNLPERIVTLDVQKDHRDLFFHLDLIMHISHDGTVYLGKDVLTRKSEQLLKEIVGENRIQYIPYSETESFALNTILYDKRFGSKENIALIKEEAHVLKKALQQRDYRVCSFEEAYPHGGGSVRCRMASLEVGTTHTCESFLEEQAYIENILGPDYAVVPSTQKVLFEKIFNPNHLEDIIKVGEENSATEERIASFLGNSNLAG